MIENSITILVFERPDSHNLSSSPKPKITSIPLKKKKKITSTASLSLLFIAYHLTLSLPNTLKTKGYL